MSIVLKGNPNIVEPLFDVVKNFKWSRLENIQVLGIPSGKYNKENLINILKVDGKKFSFEKGTFQIGIIHFNGFGSGSGYSLFSEYIQVQGNSLEETVAEHLEFHNEWYTEPFSGIMVYCAPEEKEILKVEKEFARIYIVV